MHRHLHQVPWYSRPVPQVAYDVAGWAAGAVIVIILVGLAVAIGRWKPPSF